jgi:hypothetical protein
MLSDASLHRDVLDQIPDHFEAGLKTKDTRPPSRALKLAHSLCSESRSQHPPSMGALGTAQVRRFLGARNRLQHSH